MSGGSRVEFDILANLVRRASLSMDLNEVSYSPTGIQGKSIPWRGRTRGKSEGGGSLTYPDLPPSIQPTSTGSKFYPLK